MKKRIFALITLCIFLLTSFSTVITIKIKSVEMNDDNVSSFENPNLFIENSLITMRNKIRPHLYGIDVQNSNIVFILPIQKDTNNSLIRNIKINYTIIINFIY